MDISVETPLSTSLSACDASLTFDDREEEAPSSFLLVSQIGPHHQEGKVSEKSHLNQFWWIKDDRPVSHAR